MRGSGSKTYDNNSNDRDGYSGPDGKSKIPFF